MHHNGKHSYYKVDSAAVSIVKADTVNLIRNLFHLDSVWSSLNSYKVLQIGHQKLVVSLEKVVAP